MRGRKASEERTGAAKASVPNKKKRERYEERRIAVFLCGLFFMGVLVFWRPWHSTYKS